MEDSMSFVIDIKKPSGVVLEAPFYNFLQGLVSYPLTRVRMNDRFQIIQ